MLNLSSGTKKIRIAILNATYQSNIMRYKVYLK
jgi:hypothetical protein